jgi:hypothetical protein
MTVLRPNRNGNGAFRAAARVSAKRPEIERRSGILSALEESRSLIGLVGVKTHADNARVMLAMPSVAGKCEGTSPGVGDAAVFSTDDENVWPSLREAGAIDEGWDLCENARCDKSIQNTEEHDAWIEVTSEHIERVLVVCEELAKQERQEELLTFAELVRRPVGPSSVQPSEEGIRSNPKSFKASRGPPPRNGEVDEDASNHFVEDYASLRTRGWTKQHKGPWSVRARDAIAGHKARRAEQKCQATED